MKNLRFYVESARAEYEGKAPWQWNDEGVVNAISDYLSSYELSEEDREYLKTLGFSPVDFEYTEDAYEVDNDEYCFGHNVPTYETDGEGDLYI